MATSGSSNWTQTRDNIIYQVADIVGITEEGSTPNAAQISLISRQLNQFIKWLQAVHHVKIWKHEWAQKIFSAPSEVTGTDSNIYTCIRSHTSSSDNKPITGDNWTTYWKKKGSTGGSWVTSTAYTSSGDFTDSSDLIGITQAYIRKNDTDKEVEVISNFEYASLPNKTDFGDPIRINFDGKLSPTIFVNPQVEDTDEVVLHYEKIMRIEDFDASGNTPDFPVHWIDPVVWKVAHKVGIIYKIPVQELREIKREADELLSSILFSTQEHVTSMRIMPRRRR
jgi:hypothetical protein